VIAAGFGASAKATAEVARKVAASAQRIGFNLVLLRG